MQCVLHITYITYYYITVHIHTHRSSIPGDTLAQPNETFSIRSRTL